MCNSQDHCSAALGRKPISGPPATFLDNLWEHFAPMCNYVIGRGIGGRRLLLRSHEVIKVRDLGFLHAIQERHERCQSCGKLACPGTLVHSAWPVNIIVINSIIFEVTIIKFIIIYRTLKCTCVVLFIISIMFLLPEFINKVVTLSCLFPDAYQSPNIYI